MTELNELEQSLDNARTVITEGISYWNSPGYDRRRKEEHETLIENGFLVRDLYKSGELDLTTEEHEKRRGEIEVAKLILAAADYDVHGSDGSLAAQYPTDVLKRMIQVDAYRQYDVYAADDDELQQRIQSQDSKLYQLVREEIAPQLQALNEGLTGTLSELNKFQMRGLKAIYSDRLETLHEATALYIRYHGLPNVVDELEDAIIDAAEASADRERIVAELEASIEESISEVSASLHNSLRDHHHQLETELQRLRYNENTVDDTELSALLDRFESLLDEQATQQAALSDQIELRKSKLDDLDKHIERLERRIERDQLEERIESLVDGELDQLREERTRLTRQITSLEAERKELEAVYDELETDRDALTRGELPDRETTDEPVLASEARIAEFDYSSRFESTVHDIPHVTLPNGDSFDADDQYWRDHHRRTDERQRMRTLLENHTDSDRTDVAKLIDQYPQNRHSKFVVERSGRWSLLTSQALTIELRMCAHLGRFARYGADDQPATQSDLLAVINDVVRGAEKKDTPTLAGIASPTGWTAAVERTVKQGEGIGANFSRQVSIVLVDLQERTIVYNDADTVITSNIEIFEFPTVSEKAQACAETILNQFIHDNSTYVSVPAVVEGTEYREYVVALAFERLEKRGVGKRQQTKNGLVLDLRDHR